jgi:NTE family protein
MEISLALGGGGAKGNAHIGVLQVLDREGFKVKALAGTSAGGLIGSLYMAGYSSGQILERFTRLDQREMFGHSNDEQPSLLGISGMAAFLHEMLGECTFEDLAGPLAVTAVDINTGRPMILREGRVFDAVMATIAVPGIFPAREWGEYLLVDGGLINPVPVDVARELAPDLPVVAVALTELPESNETLPDPNYLGPMQVVERISRLKVAQALGVFMRSLDISGRLLTDLRLEIDKPDVIIRPDLIGIGLLERVDVTEIAAIGKAAAEEMLGELYSSVRWQAKWAKRLGIDRLMDRISAKEEP